MRKLLLTTNDNSLLEVDLIRYFEYNDEYFLIYTLNETDSKNYLKLYLVEILEELGELVCYSINDDDTWKSMQNIIKSVIKEIKANKRELLKDINPQEIEKIKIKDSRFFKLDKKLADILSSNYFDNEYISEEVLDEMIDESLIIEPVALPNDEVIILKNEEENKMEENIKPIDDNIVKIINEIIIKNVDNQISSFKEDTSLEKEIIPNVNIENVSDDINYKELYFALKEENEALTIAFDNIMNQLVAYKEKYGEL